MNRRRETELRPFRNLTLLAVLLTLAGTVTGASPPAEGQTDDATPVAAYTGERMSVNFQDVEVRSVLQLIADFAGLNLVAAKPSTVA